MVESAWGAVPGLLLVRFPRRLAGVVSAGAYLAAGNMTEALWALGGAAAALIGAGALANGARIATGIAKAARSVAKTTKAVGKPTARGGKALARGAKRIDKFGNDLKDADQRLKSRTGKYLAKKAGRNRVVIE